MEEGNMNTLHTIVDIDQFEFTGHSRSRAGQRAITMEAVTCVVTYGCVYRAGSHDVAYWLNNRALKAAGKAGHRMRKFNGICVVVTHTNTIKTVMHCKRAPRHWAALM